MIKRIQTTTTPKKLKGNLNDGHGNIDGRDRTRIDIPTQSRVDYRPTVGL